MRPEGRQLDGSSVDREVELAGPDHRLRGSLARLDLFAAARIGRIELDGQAERWILRVVVESAKSVALPVIERGVVTAAKEVVLCGADCLECHQTRNSCTQLVIP